MVGDPAPLGPADPAADGRLFSGRAIAMVAISIGLGVVMQAIAYQLSRDPSRNVDNLIRWSIFLTVVQYAVVATIVLSQITPKIRLLWGPGSPVSRIAAGAAVGLGGGGVILLLLRAASGTLTSDQRVVQLMSGGEASRIIAATLLACLAAPVVEEVLFRGLLLESLRRYHVGMALLVSSMFFAVWHLNKKALIYYTAMGCIFGGLYIKRGLLASMTGHFCFNGILTAAAVVIVLGPGHTYDLNGLQVSLPAGWTENATETDNPFVDDAIQLAVDGPDGSGIVFFDLAGAGVDVPEYDPDAVAQRLATSEIPLPTGSSYDATSVRQVDLPTVGRAVEADFTVGANRGELVFFAAGGRTYFTMFINGGSSKAASDFDEMLNTMRPVPSGLLGS
jgi:membrane protease YdiL (CAAX protease family)